MAITMGLTLERLRREGEAFMTEVSREYYRAHAGLKAGAELQPIYDRHAAVLGEEALALVLEAFRDAAEGSEERRSARLLAEWQAESQSARQLAAHEEREITWEGAAAVRLPDGREIPYQRASIEIANTADVEERHRIERARAALVARELAPMKRERLERERDITEALAIADGYVATFEALSGVPVLALRAECEAFLRETQAMWDEVLPEFLRRGLGLTPREATRADALALFRAREFDGFFPSASMEGAVRRQVTEMGSDPTAAGRVTFDTGEREGKRSRAFCAPVRVPDEVYLVLRPHGGQTDWNTLLHELGHALHFAYMRPGLAFEYRWLGDNSVTEGYAMLFDHLLQDRGWLLRYTELGKKDVGAFLRVAGFEELHFLRRYCAKLVYETELYGGRAGWGALPDLYVERLTSATTFRYDPADAFVDVDARFYAARYLRAWQLQALITESLVERFDADWFRNPRAGPWIERELFGEGQRELAGEQAQRVAGKGLSFAPLVRSIEALLAAR
ncbi:MAG TPA: hypothetical protein VNA89_02115 [Gemmatimonadaceae bacterium]|nr:hypothetical protein [Gemmatimonadaceae bacterium]